MRNKLFNFTYLSLLIIFIIIQKYYRPSPIQKELFPNELVEGVNLIKKRINYKIKDNFLNNNVFIGDTMYILNYPAFEVKIVPLSSWSNDFLDMELLATHIPELVIQSKNIIYLGDNNYVLAEKNKRYFTQACLISSENFFYKPVVTKKEVKRFSQISSWKKIIQQAFYNNILFNKRKSYGCLLTTISSDNFIKGNKEMFEIIYKQN